MYTLEGCSPEILQHYSSISVESIRGHTIKNPINRRHET
jgi:hypothetical protein